MSIVIPTDVGSLPTAEQPDSHAAAMVAAILAHQRRQTAFLFEEYKSIDDRRQRMDELMRRVRLSQ